MTLIDWQRARRALAQTDPLLFAGRVRKVSGIVVEATLPSVAVGTACELMVGGDRTIAAEVVGFSGAQALLMPFGELEGIREGCLVQPRNRAATIKAGDPLLGRVVDGSMTPLDGGPTPLLTHNVSLLSPAPSPMGRKRISRPVSLGIRALDACLTCGEGQRLGVMAGPGVGKSVLLGMLARNAAVDVIVVGLIGERSREVREFVERDLGPQGLRRSVVVVATADESPLVRVRGAMAATALAEYFRGRGRRVLLLMDSLTRVAMAQREIGLAAGEPPTSRGYPPSVFALIPRLLERAGNDGGKGSMTAIYTVLVEEDDLSGPIADAAKGTLDGHIVLSRRLANAGQFPAVDILASVSRCMTDVVPRNHVELARRVRELLAVYRDSADLIEVGAYVAGSNPKVDQAIRILPRLNALFRQLPSESHPLNDTLARVAAALGPAPEGAT